jgi:hypothetical protein
VIIANRASRSPAWSRPTKLRALPLARVAPEPFSGGWSATPCPTMRDARPRRSTLPSTKKDIRGSDLPRCVRGDVFTEEHARSGGPVADAIQRVGQTRFAISPLV